MSTAVARGQRLVDGAAGGVDRVADLVARHRESLVWLGGLLLVSGIASAINLGGSPQRGAGEGQTVSRALGVLDGTQSVLAPSGLGWAQIAGYGQATGAFTRNTVEVAAGREAVVVASLVAVALVWGIARRLGLSRPASVVAGLLFALSPLALTLHRIADTVNVAVPWLLAALLVLVSRRRQPIRWAVAALFATVAVLSNDLALLALPVLVWMAARDAEGSDRTRGLVAAGSTLAVVGGGWLLLAALRGQLENGPAGVFGSIVRLLGATPGGSDPGVIGEWAMLDPVVVLSSIPAALAALAVRRLRPFAVLLLGLGIVVLRAGSHPTIADGALLLPFAALLVPAVVDLAIRGRAGALRRARLVLVSAVALGAIVLAVVTWGAPLRVLIAADRDAPVRSAVEWMRLDVPRGAAILADDAVLVDLRSQGRTRSDLVSAVPASGAPDWRDADYLVGTRTVRDAAQRMPALRDALAGSVPVAAWGRGEGRVDVRRIVTIDDRAAARASYRADAAAYGTQVAGNAALSLASGARRLLESGRIDPRISIALGAELATAEIRVASFPRVSGDIGDLRRQVLIESIAGSDVVNRDGTLSSAAQQFVALLDGPYRPVRADSVSGRLLITYPSDIVAPDGD